jgi:hypothetical protein
MKICLMVQVLMCAHVSATQALALQAGIYMFWCVSESD